MNRRLTCASRCLAIAALLLLASPAHAWDISYGEDPITKDKTADIVATNGGSGAEALKVHLQCRTNDAGMTMISVVAGGLAGSTDIASEPKTIRVTVDARPVMEFQAVPLREPNGELSFTATQAAEARLPVLIAELRQAQEKIVFEIQGSTYSLAPGDTGTIQKFADACRLSLPAVP